MILYKSDFAVVIKSKERDLYSSNTRVTSATCPLVRHKGHTLWASTGALVVGAGETERATEPVVNGALLMNYRE